MAEAGPDGSRDSFQPQFCDSLISDYKYSHCNVFMYVFCVLIYSKKEKLLMLEYQIIALEGSRER